IDERTGNAEAEAAQCEAVRVDERLEENARGPIAFRIVLRVGRRRVAVAAAAVAHAVEIAHPVIHETSGNVASELQTEFADGHEGGGKTALDEPQVCRRLQALQSDRHLEL